MNLEFSLMGISACYRIKVITTEGMFNAKWEVVINLRDIKILFFFPRCPLIYHYFWKWQFSVQSYFCQLFCSDHCHPDRSHHHHSHGLLQNDACSQHLLLHFSQLLCSNHTFGMKWTRQACSCSVFSAFSVFFTWHNFFFFFFQILCTLYSFFCFDLNQITVS